MYVMLNPIHAYTHVSYTQPFPNSSLPFFEPLLSKSSPYGMTRTAMQGLHNPTLHPSLSTCNTPRIPPSFFISPTCILKILSYQATMLQTMTLPLPQLGQNHTSHTSS